MLISSQFKKLFALSVMVLLSAKVSAMETSSSDDSSPARSSLMSMMPTFQRGWCTKLIRGCETEPREWGLNIATCRSIAAAAAPGIASFYAFKVVRHCLDMDGDKRACACNKPATVKPQEVKDGSQKGMCLTSRPEQMIRNVWRRIKDDSSELAKIVTGAVVKYTLF